MVEGEMVEGKMRVTRRKKVEGERGWRGREGMVK